MSEKHESFPKSVDERLDKDDGLTYARNIMDELSCSDLLSMLTIMSEKRSQEVSIRGILAGNRFNKPSGISQKLFHFVEGEIFETVPDIDFIELSPLQPFGINTVLGGINERNVVPSLRRSEANADATTALFRVALNSLLVSGSDNVTLATNTRTTRSQVYEEGSIFLPHFKVFAEVTVGHQNDIYGEKELEGLATHMANEMEILEKIQRLSGDRLFDAKITIGNTLFTKKLLDNDTEEIRSNTRNQEYILELRNRLGVQENIRFDSPNLGQYLRSIGFTNGVKVLEKFQLIIKERYPELYPKIMFDVCRIQGVNYYKHLAYKISLGTSDGRVIDFADGGTTSWAQTCTGDKQLYTVSSGIGTEVLCNYLV